MQNSVCEDCCLQWQAGYDQRRQQHAAARTLGLMGARGSEIPGAAVGAVGDAGAAASRYFVAGAAAGTPSAWIGDRLQEPPRLEVQLPCPAGLPPPLPVKSPASGAPSASEGAGVATREADRRATDQRHKELED